MSSKADRAQRQHNAALCVVCQYHRRPSGADGLCRLCQRSYDRFNRSNATTLGLIEWAASRAHLFARRWARGHL